MQVRNVVRRLENDNCAGSAERGVQDIANVWRALTGHRDGL